MRAAKAGTWATPIGLAVAGIAAAAGAAAAGAVSSQDAVKLLEESGLGSAAVGGLAALALTFGRRARLGVQIAVAAGAPVAAVGVGIVWATSSMFLTAHDQSVLWVVLIAAGTVGMISALLLGRRVATASRMVGQLARRLDDHDVVKHPAGAAPAELARVADELRTTSARLAEAREQAAATEKARRDLVAWVSHDLRTPLAGIRLMVEALEEQLVEDPETVARYHATIRTEADRLAGLVDDLFELSRLQAGSARFDLTVTALDEVVADAVDGATVAARTTGVELRHFYPKNPVPVAVDTAAMIRVVRNLVDNAIRHTLPGGKVTVRTALTDGPDATSSITVTDECGGIPERDLARVFEAGYRGDPSRTPGPTGGGFGLAIARGLVEAHRGDISVVNTGCGCRFEVRLPAVSGDTDQSLTADITSVNGP